MKTDGLNTGRDWKELQETNDSFIVLDSNDLIVSCNDKAQKALSCSHLHFNLEAGVEVETNTNITFPLDCFWLEAEQRTYHFGEFKNIAGKTIELLFMPSDCEAYRVKVRVEAFCLFGQQYYNLLVQDELSEFDVENIRQPSRMAQVLSADLKRNRLELHYQPQINVLDHSLYGVEVLARWNSAEFGQVAPDEFVAIAEDFGLIAELDLWVLRQACEQLAAWRKKNIHVPMIAVNFSPVSFNYPNLKNIIQSIFKENNISLSDLVLEITESKMLKPADPFVNTIANLHATGINISLDDFGTGYSNLKRLLKFPVSQLKLDRVFVNELSRDISKKISEMVFSISKEIDAVLIAEGVETERQYFQLKKIGYEVIQGYFFSPPISSVDFETWHIKKYAS